MIKGEGWLLFLTTSIQKVKATCGSDDFPMSANRSGFLTHSKTRFSPINSQHRGFAIMSSSRQHLIVGSPLPGGRR